MILYYTSAVSDVGVRSLDVQNRVLAVFGYADNRRGRQTRTFYRLARQEPVYCRFQEQLIFL